MVDLHCHILPNVDDGSKSMEETVELLKSAKKAGFDTVCFTPHFAEFRYVNSRQNNLKVLEEVQKRINEENIGVKLLLGNELFISDQLAELLENKQVSSLADTHYILVEFPMYQAIEKNVVKKLLDFLFEKGYKVIVAHPERYSYIQESPKKILDYFGENVIFQGNYASIIGRYRKEAQRTIKRLLENKVIGYLASDTHRLDKCIYNNFNLIEKKLLKVIDEEYFEVLTEINPRRIIENKEIVRGNIYEHINGN